MARVDDWLRRSLDPTSGQVARVVRKAMAVGQQAPSPGRAWLRPAAATAAVSLLAAMLVWLGSTRWRGPGADAPAHPMGTTLPTITNASGAVELRLHPAPIPGVAGCRVTVFNCDGLVAAKVTNGGIQYVVVGGDT